jgi:hypothetical protein
MGTSSLTALGTLAPIDRFRGNQKKIDAAPTFPRIPMADERRERSFVSKRVLSFIHHKEPCLHVTSGRAHPSFGALTALYLAEALMNVMIQSQALRQRYLSAFASLVRLRKCLVGSGQFRFIELASWPIRAEHLSGTGGDQ